MENENINENINRNSKWNLGGTGGKKNTKMVVNTGKTQHQDNLKMELYHRFKTKFPECKYEMLAEYHVPKCRFDLLMYDKETLEVLCLIEIRRLSAKKPPNKDGKKHIKYFEYCKNIYYLSKYDEIDDFLNRFEKFLNKV